MASGPVLINARAATRPELGGVERWAREMASRLPQLDLSCLDSSEGMCTDGKSIRLDTSLNARASR